MSYKIIRFHLDPELNKVVKTGLTLKEARKHCQNPETSSSTCKSEVAVEYTKKYGRWFEGYTKEKDT